MFIELVKRMRYSGDALTLSRTDLIWSHAPGFGQFSTLSFDIISERWSITTVSVLYRRFKFGYTIQLPHHISGTWSRSCEWRETSVVATARMVEQTWCFGCSLSHAQPTPKSLSSREFLSVNGIFDIRQLDFARFSEVSPTFWGWKSLVADATKKAPTKHVERAIAAQFRVPQKLYIPGPFCVSRLCRDRLHTLCRQEFSRRLELCVFRPDGLSVSPSLFWSSRCHR